MTIVFIMTKLIPGNEAHVVAGANATPAQVNAVSKQLGLDQPVPVQYLHYLNSVLHGNLGTSITSHQPVISDIETVLPSSIQFIAMALILALALSIPAATIAAAKSGGMSDTISRVFVIIAAGLPTFWLALLLQWLLGGKLQIFPVSGAQSIGVQVPNRTGMTLVDSLLAGNIGAFFDALDHLIVPATVLALAAAAQFYRALRTELLLVLERDHITVARAKGVPDTRILLRHALPNAIGSVLTLVGLAVGILVVGAVLVESIFGLPGIGSYIDNAVNQDDISAVLGSVISIGVVVVAANFAVDVLQMIRDPRIRASALGGVRSRG
jgi:peptide/nickel transport system permease protein